MAGPPPGPPAALTLPAGVSNDDALDYLDKNLTSDLLHILQECGVPLALQYKLGSDFKNVKRFAAYADSRTGVREALKTDHTLEPADQVTRAAVASVVSAWESCKEYSSKESELRAEAKVLGITRPVTQTERQAMRASFEATYGKVEESFEPSDDYVSTKMEEIENGELSASSLSEVTSRKQVKTMGLQTSVDTGGHVRIVKQRAKGVMPQNTEELRAVLRVEGTAFCYLASKYRNKVLFTGMNPTIWLDYANYLLGEKVYRMQIPTGSKGSGKQDQMTLRPPWTVMLTYEYELRKEAIKRAVRESRELRVTLKEVCDDPQLKEQFFTAPIALGGHRIKGDGWKGDGWKRQNAYPDFGGEQPWKWQKGGGKPPKGKDKKGKGGGDIGKERKGKGKGELASRTPDGRLICFAYSTSGCDGSCLVWVVKRTKQFVPLFAWEGGGVRLGGGGFSSAWSPPKFGFWIEDSHVACFQFFSHVSSLSACMRTCCFEIGFHMKISVWRAIGMIDCNFDKTCVQSMFVQHFGANGRWS